MTDTRSLTYRQNQTICHVPIKFADQFYIRFNCNCKMPVTLKSLIVDVHNNASKAYNSQADCHRFIIIIRVQRIQCLKPTIQQLAIKSCNPAISHSSLSLSETSFDRRPDHLFSSVSIYSMLLVSYATSKQWNTWLVITRESKINNIWPGYVGW